jgi:hypothetical protein
VVNDSLYHFQPCNNLLLCLVLKIKTSIQFIWFDRSQSRYLLLALTPTILVKRVIMTNPVQFV